MKKSEFTIQKSGIFFLMYMIILIFGSVLLGLLQNTVSKDLLTILTLTVPYVLIGIVINIYVNKYDLTNKTADIKPTLMQVFFMCPLLIFVYPIMMFVSTLSMTIYTALYPTVTSNVVMNFSNETAKTLSMLGPVGSMLIFAVLPAYVEEFAFRGIIFGAFRKYGFIWAMIVSSISFSLMHMTLEQLVYTMLMGMFLAFIREITGSVWPGVVLHIGFNGMSVVSYFLTDTMKLGEEASQITVGQTLLELGIISLVAIVVVVFLIIKLMKICNYKFKKEPFKLEIPYSYLIIWAICGCLSILTL